jgi:23S rRNA pseudouridine1911/1915/1917 synthase
VASLPPASDAPSQGRSLVLWLSHSREATRLDLFLCEHLPGRSRAFIQKLIHEGNVFITSGVPPASEAEPPPAAKPSSTVAPGAVVKVTIPPIRKLDLVPENIPLEIVFEDAEFAVINKPPGLVVHPSPHQDESTLVHGLLYHLKDLSGIGGEERPGIVHRLDRDTSGVLLVAKSDRAHQQLSSQFKARTVQKTYWAIVRGEPAATEGRLDLPIGRSYYHRKKMMVRSDRGSREAITEYRILEDFGGYSLAEVYPRTGRTHQIRVHLSKIRLPVACDQLYGREKRIYLSDLTGRPREVSEEPLIARQALHARSIRFHHPVTGEEMVFEVALPADMSRLLEALRRHRRPSAPRGEAGE